jgi:glucosamine-6-phosphate deaminase
MSDSPTAPPSLRTFRAGRLPVDVFRTNDDLGRAAAAAVAARLRQVLAGKETARVILATGNSQFSYTSSLLSDFALPWHRIECFHMDEYVGMDANHPASFRRWMRERVEMRAHPLAFHYIRGDNPDPQAECARYAALLAARPIDVISLGVGENGHIAFNDPPVADFNDPAAVKIVPLDEACKRQQVGEGHFPDLAAVPTHAITLTIPTLLNVAAIFCLVPESRKAAAIRDALEGPVATACPASVLRGCSNARLFLDVQSAALLSQPS